MKQQPDERRMHELFQAMKRHDAARAPGFGATMQRAAGRKPWWKTPLVPIGFGLALTGATAAVALVLVVSQGSDRARTSVAVHGPLAPSPDRTEPLAALLQRPAGALTDSLDSQPIPTSRLLGGWE